MQPRITTEQARQNPEAEDWDRKYEVAEDRWCGRTIRKVSGVFRSLYAIRYLKETKPESLIT